MFRKRAKPDQDASDEEIVFALQRSMEAERFAVLYDRYKDKVYQRCLSLARDKQLAADFTHDVFLKAFVSLPKFDHRSRFGTWLYSIAYNYCLDQLRKQAKSRTIDLDDSRMASNLPEDTYEAELLELRAEALDRVLQDLMPEDRALLLMKYQDDVSVKEMAEINGTGESAVKMRLLRARERAMALYRKLYPDES
ncbi:MAG: sigma-70 family RNA polymerase sigma factor [Flavobacteriales bacterium]|nr:sigma-70 family RNA polymerase sigma factor [Flavobacteriales bacterium]